MPRAVGLVLLAAACASYPSGPVTGGPPCSSDSECPAGQTCQQHNCFAGVPNVEFAAELFAPTGRTDMLARAEVDPLTISSTGQVDVMFAKSIEISGRVLLRSTDPTAPSVAAKVSFHRPSRIPGAPDYVVTVDAAEGKLPGQVAFTVRLAPNVDDETYDVTIFPDDGSLHAPAPGTLAPNALAPPLTLSGFHLKTSFSYDFTCDSGGLRTVTGNIVDAFGTGLAGMVVRAYSPLSQSTNNDTQLVSSTAVTDGDGHYVLYLPKAKAQSFDLHVSSSVNRSAPSLVRRDVQPVMAARDTAAVYVAGVVNYPPFPALLPYTLPVAATDASNPSGTVPAVGATVQLATTLSANGSDLVTFQTDAIVGADGLATATLIPGTALEPRSYTLTVLPPPASSGQSLWDRVISVGAAGGTLDEIVLDARAHVTGRLVDSQGKPVPNMTVQPQLAPTFTANLKADALNRLTTLSLPQAASDDKGAFGLYLDPKLLGHDATYDLELVPPSGSILPRWSRDAVAVTAASVDLGDVKLPAATLASGVVRDENGAPVGDAEVRVYMRSDDTTRLRTTTKSSKDGTISLVLPSP